ncbi:MAG: hypothetical protein OHK0022_31520 [Roseiflexaceae bacterium]
MSSFFSSLISRSLASEVQIAPRPVAHFEPPSAGLGLPPDPPAMLEEEHVFQMAGQPRQEAPARVTVPQGRIEPPVPVRDVPPAPMPRVAEAAVLQAGPAPVVPTLPAAPAQRVLGPEVAQGTLHMPLPALDETATPPVQPVSPRVNRPVAPVLPALPPRSAHPASSGPVTMREHQPHSAEPQPPQPTVYAPAQPPEAARQRATPLLEEGHTQAVPPVVPRLPEVPRTVLPADAALPEATRTALLVQPQITLATPRESVPDQAVVPPPAPVIQVTIGRIEVRAAASSARPERARTAPATMSLEEYLRQRSNGGSR